MVKMKPLFVSTIAPKMKEKVFVKIFRSRKLKGTPVEKHLLNANAEDKYSDCKRMMFPRDVFIKHRRFKRVHSGEYCQKETTIKDFVMNKISHDNNIRMPMYCFTNHLLYFTPRRGFVLLMEKIISGSYTK